MRERERSFFCIWYGILLCCMFVYSDKYGIVTADDGAIGVAVVVVAAAKAAVFVIDFKLLMVKSIFSCSPCSLFVIILSLSFTHITSVFSLYSFFFSFVFILLYVWRFAQK